MNRSLTTAVSNQSRVHTGGRTALVALIGLAAALVAVFAGTASAQAASLGSKLNSDVQPSNSSPAHKCSANPTGKCTWVQNEAYGNPGGEESPKTGYLRKVKLIAGTPGKFKLQIAKTKPNGKTKIVRNGPKINYQGQDQANWNNDDYKVEKYKVKVPIHSGERLAIKAKKTSMLRCSSGGDNTLLYTPPLAPGGSLSSADDDDGCWMLIQGKVR